MINAYRHSANAAPSRKALRQAHLDNAADLQQRVVKDFTDVRPFISRQPTRQEQNKRTKSANENEQHPTTKNQDLLYKDPMMIFSNYSNRPTRTLLQLKRTKMVTG